MGRAAAVGDIGGGGDHRWCGTGFAAGLRRAAGKGVHRRSPFTVRQGGGCGPENVTAPSSPATPIVALFRLGEGLPWRLFDATRQPTAAVTVSCFPAERCYEQKLTGRPRHFGCNSVGTGCPFRSPFTEERRHARPESRTRPHGLHHPR